MSQAWDQLLREGWYIKEEVTKARQLLLAPATQALYPLRSPCHFLQAKQSLAESAAEQGVHLTQLLLNTDLRKVSHVHLPAVKAIVHMDQISYLGADR